MTQQLALSIPLHHAATLNDFIWTNNDLLCQQINHTVNGIGEKLLYIWGAPGSGKSHILQACCQTNIASHNCSYVPLKLLQDYGPEILEGLEQQQLIALDDIDSIHGNEIWEEALFHFYNRIRDQNNSHLIISGRDAPMNMPIKLLDLRSRLNCGLVMQIHELPDVEKIKILQLHAQNRGFALPTNVGHFLLNRCARDMHELLELLNRLDHASLIAQRKLTIPFVKQTLNL
jgi:DnaA-homolog protein